eukprot:m.3189 g.3189  ORF g.3189 m.3189 type:complete len:215 (+) comp3304_c0_seq1:106-750(+)
MGGKGSKGRDPNAFKPSSLPGARVFKVRENDYKLEGVIVVHNLKIYFEARDTDVVKSFNIGHLRSYGQKHGDFSFMTGRKSVESPNTLFSFTVLDGSDIHVYLKDHIRVEKMKMAQEQPQQSTMQPSSSMGVHKRPPPQPQPTYDSLNRTGNTAGLGEGTYHSLDRSNQRPVADHTYDSLGSREDAGQTYDSLQNSGVQRIQSHTQNTYDVLNH